MRREVQIVSSHERHRVVRDSSFLGHIGECLFALFLFGDFFVVVQLQSFHVVPHANVPQGADK